MASRIACRGSGRLLFAGLTAVALAGCAPRIRSFEVEPRAVCRGDAPSTVTWDATGNVAMTVELEPDQVEPGGADAAIATPGPLGTRLVRLRLVARRHGGEAAQTRWIQQFPATFDDEVVFPTAPAADGVVARGKKNPERWNDRFELSTVSALGGRRIEVTHAGRTASLAADGASSPVFGGTPLAGDWELRWQSERGSEPPESLAVRAAVRCRRGPP